LPRAQASLGRNLYDPHIAMLPRDVMQNPLDDTFLAWLAEPGSCPQGNWNSRADVIVPTRFKPHFTGVPGKEFDHVNAHSNEGSTWISAMLT